MAATEITRIPRNGLATRFATRFEIDPGNVMAIVAATIFKQGKDEAPLSPEEVNAAMIVCNEYDLNPFTKEIYAFRSKGKLLIYVSVDGWCKIINRQKDLDGIEFQEHFDSNGKISAVTCRIFRKDRRLPIVVTEYYTECRRNTDPWNVSPIRMTRHRSLIQCARVAFSISGIGDEDEAVAVQGEHVPAQTPNAGMIDGSLAKVERISQDQAREYSRACKDSGYTAVDSKQALQRIAGIGSSLDIPADKYKEAMAWATKNPNWPDAAPEVTPDEKICREMFVILQYDLAKQAEAIESVKGDWSELASKLNKELPTD